MLSVKNRNQIKFTSTPIHDVKVKTIEGAIDDCSKMVFSRLDKNCAADQMSIKNLKDHWNGKNYLAEEFCDNFLSPKTSGDYFVLEHNGAESLSDRIAGVLKVNHFEDEEGLGLDLSLIATSPKHMKKNYQREIKGIGEILLGEAMAIAKKIEAKKMQIASTCDEFYIHAFKNAELNMKGCFFPSYLGSVFHVKNHHFDKYLNYLSKEYKTDF